MQVEAEEDVEKCDREVEDGSGEEEDADAVAWLDGGSKRRSNAIHQKGAIWEVEEEEGSGAK